MKCKQCDNKAMRNKFQDLFCSQKCKDEAFEAEN